MKNIFSYVSLFVLMGMVSSEVTLANSKRSEVLLHCSGYNETSTGSSKRHGYSLNIVIEKNGEWIAYLGKKRQRTKTSGNEWMYVYETSYAGYIMIGFNKKTMSLDIETKGHASTLNCFPIKSPF